MLISLDICIHRDIGIVVIMDELLKLNFFIESSKHDSDFVRIVILLVFKDMNKLRFFLHHFSCIFLVR